MLSPRRATTLPLPRRPVAMVNHVTPPRGKWPLGSRRGGPLCHRRGGSGVGPRSTPAATEAHAVADRGEVGPIKTEGLHKKARKTLFPLLYLLVLRIFAAGYHSLRFFQKGIDPKFFGQFSFRPMTGNDACLGRQLRQLVQGLRQHLPIATR